MGLVRKFTEIHQFVRFYSGRSLTQPKMLTLYGDEASPPVRFVMMTAATLGVDLNFHKVDLFRAENKTDFYTKINPLQKVPALATELGIICESHAIALYLCCRSGNPELYPDDPEIKARVDQMLFFNSGALFPADSSIFTDYFAGKWHFEKRRVEHWHCLIDYLELKLKDHAWLAHDKMLLCDICCGATVSSLQLLVPLADRHVRVAQWLAELRKTPCFDINSRGLQRLAKFVQKIQAL